MKTQIKKTSALILTLGALFGAITVQAQLIAYDSMSYSGTQVNAGTAAPSGTPTQTASGGFTGTWAAAAALTWNSFGLAYPSLPVTGGSLQNLGANNDYEQVASAPNSGSVWVSFIFRFNGTPGGNRNGIIIEDTAGSGVMFSYHQNSGTQAFPCLVPMTAITTKGTELTPDSSTLRTVANSNLYVLKFTYTAGVVSRVDVYSNPTANQGTAPSADFSVTSGLPSMGAIVKIGMNDSTADPLQYDEVRVGNTFGDVVGYNPAIVAPSTPTGLGATPGVNSVGLSWTASTGSPDSYNVKRSANTGGPYTTISTAGAVTGTSYTDSVAGGTTYYYVVSAVNLGGESTNSLEVSAAPTLGVPSAPTGLTALASDSQVALKWAASLAATGYNVKRSTTTGTEVTIASVNTTNYTDSTVVNGTTYFYEVSATNSAGESANSSEVSASPVAYIPVYEPFNYATGTFNNGTATTGAGETGTWTNGAAGTIVAGLTYSGLPTGSNALSSSAGRQTVSFTSLLSSGTNYISFLLNMAGNSGGNVNGVYFLNGGTGLYFGQGGFGISSSQGPLFLGTTTTTGTSASASTQVGSSFTYNFGQTYLVVLKIVFPNTVTAYINPAPNSSAPGTPAATLTSTINVGTISGMGVNVQGGATVTVDEIRTGTTYGSVVGYNPPTAPTGLTATPGVNTVGLSWTAVGGATGYNVLRGTSSGGETLLTSVGTASYNDNSAVGGQTYFYEVQATNTSGASPNSSEVSAMPTIAVPDQVTGLTATGTNSAVLLGWNLATGATGYNILRSTSTGTETFFDTTGVTSYTDSTAVNGTTYFYKVVSTNSAGNAAASSEASATPNSPPTAPTGLIATPGSGQVALSWTGSAGAVSYNIKRSTTSGAEVTIATTVDPTVTYTDTTAIKFTQYYYEVSAVNANGESANSSEVTATPTGVYGPSAYESFNYTTGAFANNTPSTAAGFTGNWTIPTGATIIAGLTYAGLPTSNNAYQHIATASQNTVNLASPLSTGTAYVSFLIKDSGDSGGDTVGVFLKGSNANSLFCGFVGGFSSSQTQFGLGTVNSSSLGGATPLGSVTPISNTTVHLVVLRIDFNTSGANDTVSLWIDPPAGVLDPGAAANVVNSTFDVGTISAFGINISGGYSAQVDEVRFGQVYGDVVGYNPVSAPSAPTGLMATPGLNQVALSWTGSVGAVSYNIKRSTTSGAEVTIGTTIDPTVTYTDTTAVGGTTYYYEVSAVNAGGESANSSEVSTTPTSVNTTPTNIVTSVSGNQLTLSWPTDYTGWTLQSQTNSLSTGLSGTWYDVAGSTTTNQVIITIDPTSPAVFYRMKY